MRKILKDWKLWGRLKGILWDEHKLERRSRLLLELGQLKSRCEEVAYEEAILSNTNRKIVKG